MLRRTTLSKLPWRVAWVVISSNQLSTRLSHDALVGMKSAVSHDERDCRLGGCSCQSSLKVFFRFGLSDNHGLDARLSLFLRLALLFRALGQKITYLD